MASQQENSEKMNPLWIQYESQNDSNGSAKQRQMKFPTTQQF